MSRTPSLKTMVLMALGVIFIGFLATMWTFNMSVDAKQRYNALRAEVPEEEELQEQLAESQYSVDEYRAQLDHLEAGVPGLAYVPTLLQELEELGRQHQITVTGVRPIVDSKSLGKGKGANKKELGEAKKAYQEIMIDITGRGTYANVMGMVEALKTFPKIIAVQTVGLQPKRVTKDLEVAPGDGPLLDVSIRIKAFLFTTDDKATDKSAVSTS
ncbi:MAG: type 4a pilus biogenesis protein PilO [Fimbriimonadaceae bacterium]|nr:type 4a pilus biogenesis protein PilO [Fimbriimonadaceae bacterium]QYK56000.1 MAG: type 4a pilus biogenesis protein PilO [Fimbriimonadaceae bacterium]